MFSVDIDAMERQAYGEDVEERQKRDRQALKDDEQRGIDMDAEARIILGVGSE